MSLKHAFTDLIADDPALPTFVRPSNWNEEHTFPGAGAGEVVFVDGDGHAATSADFTFDAGTKKLTIGPVGEITSPAAFAVSSTTDGGIASLFLDGANGASLGTGTVFGALDIDVSSVRLTSAAAANASIIIDNITSSITLNATPSSQVVMDAGTFDISINSGSAGWKFDGATGALVNLFGPLNIGASGNPVGIVYGSIILPTADPGVAGALWNNAGTVTVSAG